ncbi:hypothetical protein GW915_01235 [bacterium]|nr:hypothetical protein [bacterium]
MPKLLISYERELKAPALSIYKQLRKRLGIYKDSTPSTRSFEAQRLKVDTLDGT